MGRDLLRSQAVRDAVPQDGPAHAYRVLVVDDDDAVRRMMSRYLTVHGFTIIEAENGQVALERLRGATTVNVILLDLRMPVMNGWTFRQEQRKDAKLADIPVVVLSGADDDRFDEIGAAATFHKPALASDVAQRLRHICESKGTAQT